METDKLKEKFISKYRIDKSRKFFTKELDTLLDEVVKEQIIKDREAILTSIAMELWYKEKESEDYDLAFGFDENGIPNSVSLEIYGRTHSDITIPDYKLKEK